MENLILLSRISLNTDILETNVINITLLIALLFNVVGGALKQAMIERKEKIVNSVQESEQRLQEASERLLEAKIQLNQSKLIINKIQSEKEVIIQNIALNNLSQAEEELKRQASSTQLAVIYKEQEVFRELNEKLATLALAQVIEFLKNNLKLDMQIQLISKMIELIGGKEWQAKF